MYILFFLLYAFGALAILGDVYTTMQGLKKGLKEANPLNRWLFSKLGISLTGFLEGLAYTGIGLVFASYSWAAGAAYCGLVGAVEAWQYFRNKKLLK